MDTTFADIKFEMREHSILKTLTPDGLMGHVVCLMARVETFRRDITGPDKKRIVIQLLNWITDELPIDDESRELLREAVTTVVPTMIDTLIFASRNTKVLKVFQKNCCLPF